WILNFLAPSADANTQECSATTRTRTDTEDDLRRLCDAESAPTWLPRGLCRRERGTSHERAAGARRSRVHRRPTKPTPCRRGRSVPCLPLPEGAVRHGRVQGCRRARARDGELPASP